MLISMYIFYIRIFINNQILKLYNSCNSSNCDLLFLSTCWPKECTLFTALSPSGCTIILSCMTQGIFPLHYPQSIGLHHSFIRDISLGNSEIRFQDSSYPKLSLHSLELWQVSWTLTFSSSSQSVGTLQQWELVFLMGLHQFHIQGHFPTFSQIFT
jgi:hypothetical protein